VSGLFYVSRNDNLRTYVSPRYTYSRGSSTSTTSGIFGELENELESSIHSITGSFGAQYALGSRFSAFGEVGLGYVRSTLSGSFSGVRSKSHGWSTRTGAGFILYF
jgi:opacity protein-like surface antigen